MSFPYRTSKHVTLIFVVAISAITSGCAPATVKGLRENHAGTIVFDADQNYQAVYRTVLESARRCHQTGLITAQMVVDGDLYTDIEEGTVSVALHGGFGVDTHLAIDIKAVDKLRTSVTVYHALGTWRKAASTVQEWVLDGSSECMPRAPKA